MTVTDPTLARIAARFDRFVIDKTRGGYTLHHRRSGQPAARLKWFRNSDRFELFYWSLVREAWRNFGGLGPLRLTLDEAHEIVENDPVFHLRDR